MSEQTEKSWTMSVTESELMFLCEAVAGYITERCACIERGDYASLDQEQVDKTNVFYHKVCQTVETEAEKDEDDEMFPLLSTICTIGFALTRVDDLRKENLGALLPQ